MEIQSVLQELGLSEKETSIYLQLLRDGELNASKLAHLTKINRTTVYLELEFLMRKGLVSYFLKGAKRHYRAANPQKLIELLESKKARVEAIIPQLISMPKSIQPFKIDVYEGKEGLKTFYQDILDNAKEVLAFGVTGKAFEIMEFVFPHFLKRYKKAGVKARYLANNNAKRLLEKLPSTQVKIRYLPDEFNSEVTTVIYSNKIAIQSLVENNLFVIIITDQKLFQGYKNYFEFMWAAYSERHHTRSHLRKEPKYVS